YRTGDRVTAVRGTCSCGRTLVKLAGGIAGRVDDMVTVRGVNVFPSAIEAILRRFAEVGEYRIALARVREMDELRCTVEAPADVAVMARRGLLAVRHAVERDSSGTGTAGTSLMFLGLTMLNPPTVIYFASLAIALPEVSADFASRAVFVLGAFLSSLSWQEVLAVAGASLHGRLTPRLQRITAVVSSVIILALAARVAFG